jgi:uncharacterized protein
MELEVRVIARSTRDELAGWREGRLLLRVTAAPVDGKANAAACALLAKTVGVSRGSVSVVRGANTRDKRIRIAGDVDKQTLKATLGV